MHLSTSWITGRMSSAEMLNVSSCIVDIKNAETYENVLPSQWTMCTSFLDNHILFNSAAYQTCKAAYLWLICLSLALCISQFVIDCYLNENIVVHQSYNKWFHLKTQPKQLPNKLSFASTIVLMFGVSFAQRHQETTIGIHWH